MLVKEGEALLLGESDGGGEELGMLVGTPEGLFEGTSVGSLEGSAEGGELSTPVGALDGDALGRLIGVALGAEGTRGAGSSEVGATVDP